MSILERASRLRDRAAMLTASRSFFAQRDVMEVDTPLLTSGASIDAHIDLIPALCGKQTRYLHSSPEYGMKRLLAEGICDIYQLSHVFRAGEESHKHNPEFMMAEWYRLGFSFEQMIDETCAYIQLFLGQQSVRFLSYRDAIRTFVGIDYLTASIDELIDKLKQYNIACYQGIEEEGKDAVLNLLLGTLVEPQLGSDGLLVLGYYPATQAALARTLNKEGELVAERFEVYFQGVELANGYHELTDVKEQRQRLIDANTHRIQLGKEPLPIDEFFLEGLAKGIPDCCGVAVGFDRLMMLRHQVQHIHDILPFSWLSI